MTSIRKLKKLLKTTYTFERYFMNIGIRYHYRNVNNKKSKLSRKNSIPEPLYSESCWTTSFFLIPIFSELFHHHNTKNSDGKFNPDCGPFDGLDLVKMAKNNLKITCTEHDAGYLGDSKVTELELHLNK